jgi:hypothetical protein
MTLDSGLHWNDARVKTTVIRTILNNRSKSTDNGPMTTDITIFFPSLLQSDS